MLADADLFMVVRVLKVIYHSHVDVVMDTVIVIIVAMVEVGHDIYCWGF